MDNDINLNVFGVLIFLKMFVENGISLLFLFFIMVIVVDLISVEISVGMMKFLLIRFVKWWWILMSKYILMLFLIFVIMVLFVVIVYLIFGIVFGYGGWDVLVFIGFGMKDGVVIIIDVY